MSDDPIPVWDGPKFPTKPQVRESIERGGQDPHAFNISVPSTTVPLPKLGPSDRSFKELGEPVFKPQYFTVEQKVSERNPKIIDFLYSVSRELAFNALKEPNKFIGAAKASIAIDQLAAFIDDPSFSFDDVGAIEAADTIMHALERK